jgi:hypothetical protein
VNNPKLSTPFIVGGLTAMIAFALAAVLFIQGDAAQERIGLFLALVGTVVAALISALRSDQAATSTNNVSSIAQALNGGFEARVRHATREVVAETGTPADHVRAANDAKTSAALSADPPVAPDPPIKASPKE